MYISNTLTRLKTCVGGRYKHPPGILNGLPPVRAIKYIDS